MAKKPIAPCGHDGEYVIGNNFVLCSRRCDGPADPDVCTHMSIYIGPGPNGLPAFFCYDCGAFIEHY